MENMPNTQKETIQVEGRGKKIFQNIEIGINSMNPTEQAKKDAKIYNSSSGDGPISLIRHSSSLKDLKPAFLSCLFFFVLDFIFFVCVYVRVCRCLQRPGFWILELE